MMSRCQSLQRLGDPQKGIMWHPDCLMLLLSFCRSSGSHHHHDYHDHNHDHLNHHLHHNHLNPHEA